MGWLITAAVLILIGFVRLAFYVRYDADGPLVQLLLGPLKWTLVPGKKKDNKKEKKKKDQKKADASKEDKLPTDPPPAAKPKKKKSGGSLADFLPLVKVVLDFLGEFFNRIRFQKLYFKLILAGDDPCDLAVNYGRAWAALGNLGPVLDNALHIKKRDLQIECDFEAEQTLVDAEANITITLGRTLHLLLRYGYRALKEYLNLKNKRKGGAVK